MSEQGHDGETRMTEERAQAAWTAVAKALPADHPARKEVGEVMRLMWEELGSADVANHGLNVEAARAREVIDAHAELTVVLGDWRRGIRDWDEVEAAVKRAEQAAGALT